MFRPSRRRRGRDPWLRWKSIGFFIGAGLALLGMALESELFVQVAIGILVLTWLLRFAGIEDEDEGEDASAKEGRERGG